MRCEVWIEAAKTVIEVGGCLAGLFKEYGLHGEADKLEQAVARAEKVLVAAHALANNGRDCPSKVDELIEHAGLLLAERGDEDLEDLARRRPLRVRNPA